ncbi:hypothetical protein ATG_00220 [Desulfurococcaceae archaeon AG1]|nr:hypothetical protein ATG_00220 [Desulfurococcaceae archaeon AG1]
MLGGDVVAFINIDADDIDIKATIERIANVKALLPGLFIMANQI